MRTRSLGQLQQRAEQRGDVAPAGLRRAAHALHDRVARLRLVGEAVDAVVEELGVGLGPVVEERGPQPVDRRALDAEVGVAPLVLVAGVALPLVGDADAAGEADRLVDDQHLAVGAVVELARAEPAQRPEPAHAGRRPRSMQVDERLVHRCGAPTRRAAPAPGRRRRARVGEPLGELACRSRPPSRRT